MGLTVIKTHTRPEQKKTAAYNDNWLNQNNFHYTVNRLKPTHSEADQKFTWRQIERRRRKNRGTASPESIEGK